MEAEKENEHPVPRKTSAEAAAPSLATRAASPPPIPPPTIPPTALHAVRISASKIAAVCGYHPWADAEETFVAHLYQDAALLALDAASLGVHLYSEEQQLEELVAALGRREPAAAAALTALLGSRGAPSQQQTVAEVQRVTAEARALVAATAARGALPPPAAAALDGRLRSAFNTSFGEAHEAEAVRLYERQTGCEVRESNDGLYLWPFPAGGGAPAAARRVPLRARDRRRRGGGWRRAPCGDGCGCAKLRAIDRDRASLAARRGELPGRLRELQGLLPAAAEADYRTADGGWDGEGLASDLRVAKGAPASRGWCARAAGGAAAAAEVAEAGRTSRSAIICTAATGGTSTLSRTISR